MNIEIANRLVNLRKSNNLSQEALAEKLGISRQAVSKWERAEASPDTDNLILLARLYNVSLDELLRTEDEIPMPEPEPEERAAVAVKEDSTSATGTTEAITAVPNIPGVESDTFGRSNIPGEDDAFSGSDIPGENDTFSGSNTFDESEEEEGYGGSYTIPVSVIITIVYVFVGNMFDAWHPGWMLFILIPVWNSLVSAIRTENANCFAYPILMALVYLCLGFFWGAWHPGWIVFLTTPLYYWAVSYARAIKQRRKRKTGRE